MSSKVALTSLVWQQGGKWRWWCWWSYLSADDSEKEDIDSQHSHDVMIIMMIFMAMIMMVMVIETLRRVGRTCRFSWMCENQACKFSLYELNCEFWFKITFKLIIDDKCELDVMQVTHHHNNHCERKVTVHFFAAQIL